MHVLGLDVGSSSIKAAVLDLDSNSIRDVAQRPFPNPLSGRPTGHFEIDADEVAEECRQLIGELLKVATPEGILLCGQHGGFVLVDEQGNRVSPYVSWRDLRTAEPSAGEGSLTVYEALSAELGDALRLQIGNELAPGGTVPLLYRMKLRSLLPPGVTPLGIAEYVLLRLGGGEPVIEPTCAIGMMDFTTLDHARPIYQRLGLDEVRWPTLKSYRETAGAILHGGRRIPMYPVLGDHQCALLGAGLEEGELSINVSTGSQVSLLTRNPQPSPQYQTRAYFDGYLLNTVTHLPAGRALNVLVDLLTEIPKAAGVPIHDPWKWIAELVKSTHASDLRAKLTLFPGPLGTRGEITNIGVDNLHVGDLFRAAFVDMADNYREVSRWLDPAKTSRRIALSGGLVQKLAALRDQITSRFDLPHRLSESTEETLLGMLRAAQVICGRASSAILNGA